MPQDVGVVMIGCGVVGSAVARVLLQQGDELAARTGVRLVLRRVVVRDVNRPRSVKLPAGCLTDRPAEALEDRQSSIFVELAGGVSEARTLILSALAAGKDVVTANKALLAEHGRELWAAARQQGRCIAFEAAVAGGIPLIESVRRGLIANRVDAVFGILNGTCNYILTRMLDNEASYAHALAEAQRLGYAEADPTLDVDGADSAQKLVILASLAMHEACELGRVHVRGIAGIDLRDLRAGRELGYACKLLASARRHPDGLDLSVQPTFVPLSHPLASVSGPFNAVSVYGSHVGHVLFYGRGAGGEPTASAVVADLVDVALGNAQRTFELLTVLPDRTRPAVYRAPGESRSAFYARLALTDQPGGIGKIATLLGQAGVSIATIVQNEPPQEGPSESVPVVVTTHPAREGAVHEALDATAGLDIVVGQPVCIPLWSEPSV